MKKVSTFHERLNLAISIRGFTQTQLAKITGINKSLICDYLKGRYMAKQDKLDLLATSLKVSPTWLMGLDVEMIETKKDDITPPSKNIIIKDIVDLLEDQDEATLKTILKVIKSIVQD